LEGIRAASAEPFLAVRKGTVALEEIVVGIADIKIAKGENSIVTYALGSCVGICVYDEVTGIGGMLHAMLPDSSGAVDLTKPEKYVDTGVDILYRMLCRMGADGHRLKAKLVGGAKMYELKAELPQMDIGTANVMQARRLLKKLGISLVREVTGGVVGRTIRFNPANGAVKIQATDNTTQVI
jgi:chemotaxis protein CheD